jgi:hypothetical protein
MKYALLLLVLIGRGTTAAAELLQATAVGVLACALATTRPSIPMRLMS